MTQQQRIWEDEVRSWIIEYSKRAFDHFIKNGWITLNKEKKEVVSGVTIGNFKNGAEFGEQFGRALEIKLTSYFREREPVRKVEESPERLENS